VAYKIEIYPDVRRQIRALPASAERSFAEVLVVLELTPWNGRPYHDANPDGLQNLVFGANGEGMATYLILEDQLQVEIVRVSWIG
jgi:hypothetical protein